jgi:Zn-dependent protease with chaperone function
MHLGGENLPSARPSGGERLLPEVIAAESAAPHEFLLERSDGTPVTYDPCHEISVVVNPHLAPPGYRSVVDQVLAELSAAAGLAFVVETYTSDEPPADPREWYQPTRYGDRWSPVLIAWATADDFPDLESTVAGFGGSATIADAISGELWYISGAAVIDAPQLNGNLEATRAVLLHELGHVLGLDHVDDASQLMYPETRPENGSLQAGDRAGLAVIGAGDCAPPH